MSLLEQGISTLGLSLTGEQVEKLQHLANSLLKWNRTFNLTAIRSETGVITHHLLDSLSILPFVTGQAVVDVGSGGGFPGLPLAVCLPDRELTLLDSNVKKTRFLQQMVIELKLQKCAVVHNRVEEHQQTYDQVTCRAFASLADIVDKTAHLLGTNGEILAMKARLDGEEREQLPRSARIVGTESLQVPGVDGERRLVRIRLGNA